MALGRQILLFEAVLEVVLGLLQRAFSDSKEPGELLRVVPAESLRGIALGGSDGIADLIAVLEIARRWRV